MSPRKVLIVGSMTGSAVSGILTGIFIPVILLVTAVGVIVAVRLVIKTKREGNFQHPTTLKSSVLIMAGSSFSNRRYQCKQNRTV